jgi:phage N-6-adenine-methyltransferase
MIPTFSFRSESNERYTPPAIIDAARAVMGGIELDAASCETANQIVKAEFYFTAEDNALIQTWRAKTVWCNPPYGKIKNKSMAGIFLDKMISEYDAGNFEQGIILVNACPSASWFKPAYRFPICFTDGRIAFLDYTLTPLTQPTKDNALIYIGQNVERFAHRFDPTIGTVVARF